MIKNEESKIPVKDVFTPGGFPTITYIPREDKQLEEQIAKAWGSKKLFVVTGATKSGKTVLVNKIFSKKSSIWIDGGIVKNEDEFWELALEKANMYNEIKYSEQTLEKSSVGTEVTAEGNIVLVKGGATVRGDYESGRVQEQEKKRKVSPKIAVNSMLESDKIPIIVDDFHYINKDVRTGIVKALKAHIMDGVPVIFIAIPNQKYDVLEVNREMTGRIEEIEMPVWEMEDLQEIATRGFESLNIKVNSDIIKMMSQESYGSPYLMQEFCESLCENRNITEKSEETQHIPDDIDLSEIFVNKAEHSGRNMFEKIKRGPRARKDRKQRKLKSGEKTDIYGVVVESLKALKPGIESIPYEELRKNIKEILDESEDLPQKHEISRVLDQIQKISYQDTSSVPVIDWQKNDDVITITDPFFAFYLKWAK